MNQAIAALESHGYVLQEDDSYVKFGRSRRIMKTRYLPTGLGFLRFERELERWRQYPLSIHADWAGVGGLVFDDQSEDPNARVKPECFEWVYPVEHIVQIYGPQAAPEQE